MQFTKYDLNGLTKQESIYDQWLIESYASALLVVKTKEEIVENDLEQINEFVYKDSNRIFYQVTYMLYSMTSRDEIIKYLSNEMRQILNSQNNIEAFPYMAEFMINSALKKILNRKVP